ncbi:MAG TPA: acyl-CoA thioesterase [Clostridiales bacterium]|nr:acyl-CoA thioesterase [Clostridiales bacterium]
MDKLSKTVKESRTEQVHILMPGDINGSGRLFGGALMQWIDIVAAVVARRHSGLDVTTACVDDLVFHAPAYKNDTILLVGALACVGRSSMEVRVETYVEALTGTRKLVNRAYVTMVAVDGHGKPRQVPGLVLETDSERAEWAEGEKRLLARRKRRAAQ